MSHPLENKIQRVGRLARVLTVVYGAGWFFCVVIFAAVVLGSLDYLLHLTLRLDDAGIRFVFSFTMLVVLVTAWRFLLFPALKRRWSDVEVARRIERCYPELLDRLASSTEFLKQPEYDQTAGSSALRRSVIAETEAMLERLNLYGVVKFRASICAALAALLMCAVGVTLFASSGSARLAVGRLAMPWAAAPWPKRNHLRIEDPRERLSAGDDLEIAVIDLNGQMPDNVAFQFRKTDGQRMHQVAMKPFGDKMVARLENVTQTIQYRAIGGDDDSMLWHKLEVVEPPEIGNVQISLIPPSYTAWTTETSSSHIRALQGSRIEIRGKVSKPLAEIQLKFESANVTKTVPVRLSEDGQSFAAADRSSPWIVDESGLYWFELTDREGLITGKRHPWRIQAIADDPPVVGLESPDSNLFVTSRAVVPLRAIVKDDIAIGKVELRFLQSNLSDRGEQAVTLPGDQSKEEKAKSRNAARRKDRIETRTVRFDWDLSELGKLNAGESIEFHIAASDLKPQEGLSSTRRLVIISNDELEDRLGQRQTYILGQLSEALRLQREARRQTESVTIQFDETNAVDKTDIDHLQSAELNQREVQRLLSGPGDGIEAQILGVLADLDNNRVDSPDGRRRLTELLTAIRRINKQHLPAIQREMISSLKSARAHLHDQLGPDQSTEKKVPTAVRSPLTTAIGEQDQVIAALEQLLGDLSEWDNFRRFARQLRRIGREQDEVGLDTDKLRREMIGKTVEDLSAHEKANLKVLSRRQLELARQFDSIRSRMQQMQSELAESEPLVAQTIADALDAASRMAIGGRMRESGRDIERNRLGQATKDQHEVAEGLEELMDILANRREHELGRLVEKLQQAADELEGLREQQESIREGLEDAESLTDEEEKKRQLERLTKQQQQQAEEISRLARQLKRLQADRAASATDRAAAKSRKSGESAGQGDTADALDEAKSAAKELEDAQNELAKELRQTEQELYQEKLARLEHRIQGLVGRQQNIVNETLRLDELKKSQGRLSEEQQTSVRSLSREQRDLAADTGVVAGKVEDAEAFALALRSAVREMLRAAKRLDRIETGQATQESEQIALLRLKQLLEALKKDDDEAPMENNGGETEPGGLLPPDVIQVLAELKLLKLMQQEINRRTAELEEAKMRRGGVLDEEGQRELDDLAVEQGRLADLIINLSQPSDAAPEDNPDNLPDVEVGNNLDKELEKSLDDQLLPGLEEKKE